MHKDTLQGVTGPKNPRSVAWPPQILARACAQSKDTSNGFQAFFLGPIPPQLARFYGVQVFSPSPLVHGLREAPPLSDAWADGCRVTLIEAVELLSAFDGRLREYASQRLTKRGINIVKVQELSSIPLPPSAIAHILHLAIKQPHTNLVAKHGRRRFHGDAGFMETA